MQKRNRKYSYEQKETDKKRINVKYFIYTITK